ncbi:hypothetical protein JHD46_04160, partial [Sulfurimonas sp. SAG-AH-194-C20]
MKFYINICLSVFIVFFTACGGGSDSTPKADTRTSLEKLLASGDVTKSSVSERELLQATKNELLKIKVGDTLLAKIFKDEAVDYNISNRTQVFTITQENENVFPLIVGNAGKILSIAGRTTQSRFAAFGIAPMENFEVEENLAFVPQFKRILSWLLEGENFNASSLDKNLTIAISFTGGDSVAIKNWFSKEIPAWRIVECNALSTLSQCYEGSDMIISGWESDENATQIVEILQDEYDNAKPILYFHTWYEATGPLSLAIGNMLGFSLPYGGNYWAGDTALWNNYIDMLNASYIALGYESIQKVVEHFIAQDYAFDWTQCNDEDCSNVTGFQTEFLDAANSIRTRANILDTNKRAIFKEDGYLLDKYIVLLADKFRQSIVFPMDKTTTNDTVFLKSYFSDFSVYNYRSVNPAQKDMGNFSRSDFSEIVPQSVEVRKNTRKPFGSAGVYALPGKTVKITRRDNNNARVKVFINTLRSGSTHEFAVDGYLRPKYLQSSHIEILSGESIEITSPYGGPIELDCNVSNIEVTLLFENVGKHPYWESSVDDVSFTTALAADEYDWAEIATTGFEVHSKRDKMLESIKAWADRVGV